MFEISFKKQRYQFKPSLLGLLLTIACMALFLKLGFWQYQKALLKIELHNAFQSENTSRQNSFPLHHLNVQDKNNVMWNHKHVKVTGQYEKKYEIFLDNQVSESKAGFHVVTPLKIEDTDEYVLVNRGWIPANAQHDDFPDVITPNERVEVEGVIWLPSQRYFTLDEEQKTSDFQRVWQYMDVKQYQQKVPIKVSALLIKLDKNSTAGGFVRDWSVPQGRIVTHLGYAYQWFGFTASAFLIFLYMSFVRVGKQSNANE
jgi:surfeit locus 1 family protein